jgi:hypothetical protein
MAALSAADEAVLAYVRAPRTEPSANYDAPDNEYEPLDERAIAHVLAVRDALGGGVLSAYGEELCLADETNAWILECAFFDEDEGLSVSLIDWASPGDAVVDLDAASPERAAERIRACRDLVARIPYTGVRVSVTGSMSRARLSSLATATRTYENIEPLPLPASAPFRMISLDDTLVYNPIATALVAQAGGNSTMHGNVFVFAREGDQPLTLEAVHAAVDRYRRL